MYIDTRTRESIKKSITELYGIDNNIFDGFCYMTKTEFDASDKIEFAKLLYVFLENIGRKQRVDEILLFHLTRRLNEANTTTTNNLWQLILGKNEFSKFLKERGFVFRNSVKSDYIDLYYNGKIANFNSGKYCHRIKKRLGKNEIDYCVNGFAFKDKLQYNKYFFYLMKMPEFLKDLSEHFGDYSLESNYLSQSKYYCITYKVPFTRVIIDGGQHYSQYDIDEAIIKLSLERFFSEKGDDCRDNNLIIRLEDQDSLSNKDYLEYNEIQIKDGQCIFA